MAKKTDSNKRAWFYILLVTGLIVIGSNASNLIEILNQGNSGKEFTFCLDLYKATPPISFSSSDSQMHLSPTVLSIWFLIGGLIVAVALLGIFKNFKLNNLIAATLGVAMFACVPIFLAKRVPTIEYLQAAFLTELSDDAKITFKEKLQPEIAFKTLSQEFLKQERWIGKKNYIRVTVVTFPAYGKRSYFVNPAIKGAPIHLEYTRCNIYLSNELSPTQRATITEFYADYFQYVLYSEGNNQGFMTGEFKEATFGGRWGKWRDEWISTHSQ